MRYFIEFAYFGKRYHGWQNQPNASTVQQAMEHALGKLLATPVALMGAGRTDAGVHARQMFAHFDFPHTIDHRIELCHRMNAFLPEDISIRQLFPVTESAHARFDALERTYEYWITQDKNPFLTDFSYYVRHDLDIENMNLAAALMLEHTNFACFSKSNTDVKTYICDIKKAKWEARDNVLVFTITADRFLRNMVRAIVGTLVEVGLGKRAVDDVKTILKSRDRAQAGPSVPAKGLYLTQVIYPKTIQIKHG